MITEFFYESFLICTLLCFVLLSVAHLACAMCLFYVFSLHFAIIQYILFE